jgi:hypothetical protein
VNGRLATALVLLALAVAALVIYLVWRSVVKARRRAELRAREMEDRLTQWEAYALYTPEGERQVGIRRRRMDDTLVEDPVVIWQGEEIIKGVTHPDELEARGKATARARDLNQQLMGLGPDMSGDF